MKRTIFLLFLLSTIFGCSPVNNCPNEQVEDYLLHFFDSFESISLSNYLANERIEDPAEQSILMMYDRSDFKNNLKFPECANEHNILALEVFDLLIGEVLAENSETFSNNELENKITSLRILTDELISETDNLSTKDSLQKRSEKVWDFSERAKDYFNQNESNPTNVISDEEKEKIILSSINKLLEDEPANILNQFIKYLNLRIFNNTYTFQISKKDLTEDIQKEIFKEIFIEAIYFSSDNDNNLIWELDKISVIFSEGENGSIEFFVDNYDFEKILTESVTLGDIVKIKTSSSERFVNEPPDEEKEKIIMDFINNTLDDEPENILNNFIELTDLKVENNNIVFSVKTGNLSKQTKIELFSELFLDAIIMATNSENNLIWNINRIVVVFEENDGSMGIEYYLNDDKFDEFFNNPPSLLNIFETQTYVD